MVKMFYIYLNEDELHVAVIRMIATGKWFAVGRIGDKRSMEVYAGCEATLREAAKGLTLLSQGTYEV